MKETMTDVLQLFLDSRLENVHTLLPGKIESYEEPLRKASVQPLIKLKTRGNEDVEMPILDNVPVIFPSSTGGQILFPLDKGDFCLIMFSETGIGNYLNSVGAIQVEADDVARFSLTDAICLPGLFPFSVPGTQLNKLITPTIEFTPAGGINMLKATEPYVLGNILKTLLDNFLGVLAAITPGNEAANAASLTAIKGAATAFQAALGTILSLDIKGS